MSPLLLLRVDASPAIGVGHFMRCLALAQAWQDSGGRAVFACAELPEGLRERLVRENLGLAEIPGEPGSGDDADQTVEFACRNQAAWVAVDGPRFGSDYLEVLGAAGLAVLALDDGGHLDRYPVDLVLNQNLAATPGRYAGKCDPARTTLLLGPVHALLRREFREYRAWRRPPPRTPRRLLISFGGGDELSLTEGVLRNLARLGRRDLEVVALAGATNPRIAALQELTANLNFACDLRVSVDHIAEIMAWADAAITSAGSTVWELAAMRLPALVADIGDGALAQLGDLEIIPLFRVRPGVEWTTRDLGADLDHLLRDRAWPAGLDAQGAGRVVHALRSHRGQRARAELLPVS